MGMDICSVQVFSFELAEVNFLKGFLDGGFDDEFLEDVGLGWHLHFCSERQDSSTSWKPLFEASAKTKGFSSACAEIAAFTNLVAMTCIFVFLQNIEFGDWQTIPIVAIFWGLFFGSLITALVFITDDALKIYFDNSAVVYALISAGSPILTMFLINNCMPLGEQLENLRFF